MAVHRMTGIQCRQRRISRMRKAVGARRLSQHRTFERLAEKLAERYDSKFGLLRDLKITYLWQAKGGKSNGQAVYGKCQKPAGLLRHYTRSDIVIALAANWALGAALTRFQIEAILFHELLHIQIDEETGAISLRGHDIAEFAEGVEEYGFWHAGLRDFAGAIQGRLDEIVESPLGGAAVQA